MSKHINIQTVSLDVLIPYWRNPRKNDLAIEKVKESIQAYGYQSPIVVDKKMTIIAGHTRYAALKELGYKEVDVVVSDMPAKKAKEFRIIDNRTSEYATWTNELALELKEFTDMDFAALFFPEIKLDLDFKDMPNHISQAQVDKAADGIDTRFTNINDPKPKSRITVPCPYCTEEITFLRGDLLKAEVWD